MPEIPSQAIQAAAVALAREFNSRHTNQDLARVALEAAAPFLAEHIAVLVEAEAAQPDLGDLFRSIGMGERREGMRRAARIAREAFTAGELPADAIEQASPPEDKRRRGPQPRTICPVCGQSKVRRDDGRPIRHSPPADASNLRDLTCGGGVHGQCRGGCRCKKHRDG